MSHYSKWKNLSKEELLSDASYQIKVNIDENGLPVRPWGQVIMEPVRGKVGPSQNDGWGFHWKNWVNYWHPGEWIWEGVIDKKFFKFDPLQDTMIDMYQYLTKCKYNQVLDDDYEWDTTGDMDLENFVKMIWLMDEYEKGNWQFRNKLCSHYNPRLQKIQIHPGGMRNKIVDLFGGTEVPVLFFNTGGFYNEPMMKDLQPKDLESFALVKEWSGTCVADHGSLIPHLMKDVHTIGSHKKIWHEKLSLRAQNLKIFTNIDKGVFSWWMDNPNDEILNGFKDGPIDLLRDRWFTNNPLEANVNVTFKLRDKPGVYDEYGRPKTRNQIIAMLCAFAGQNYESETMLIKCH